MATILTPGPITAEEFERLDSDLRYDLIRGELRPMPPMPGEEHGALTSDLSLELSLFVRDHDLGQCYAAETRFLIARDPDTAIGPDWAFIARSRLPKRRGRGFVPIVPDAVLEVRSPSDRKAEVEDKVALWLEAGVRIVWELNPGTCILTVYRSDARARELGVADVLSGEEVLPGFALPLRRLFPDDEPAA
jgi:Uma2 family endonuclease